MLFTNVLFLRHLNPRRLKTLIRGPTDASTCLLIATGLMSAIPTNEALMTGGYDWKTRADKNVHVTWSKACGGMNRALLKQILRAEAETPLFRCVSPDTLKYALDIAVNALCLTFKLRTFRCENILSCA